MRSEENRIELPVDCGNFPWPAAWPMLLRINAMCSAKREPNTIFQDNPQSKEDIIGDDERHNRYITYTLAQPQKWPKVKRRTGRWSSSFWVPNWVCLSALSGKVKRPLSYWPRGASNATFAPPNPDNRESTSPPSVKQPNNTARGWSKPMLTPSTWKIPPTVTWS
jgi:hypothetical protein